MACRGSFGLREFRRRVLPDAPPDHSTVSRTRRLMDVETHDAVFAWNLQRLADALLAGKTVGVDAMTLEPNAALRRIVRRDTGESYQGVRDTSALAVGHRDADAAESPTGCPTDWTLAIVAS